MTRALFPHATRSRRRLGQLRRVRSNRVLLDSYGASHATPLITRAPDRTSQEPASQESA